MENGRFIPTDPELRHTVHALWQVSKGDLSSLQETIIPKGVVELIFNFYEKPDLYAHLHKETFQLPRCFISGYNTYPIQIHLAESHSLFGAVLSPLAIKSIFRVPSGEFANCCVDLNIIDSSINSLWHKLAEQKTFARRVNIFSDWIKGRAECLTPREKMFTSLLNTKTTKSLPQLSAMLCYSPRNLSRKFREVTGMNTEQTMLYFRYLKSIELIHHTDQRLSEIAHACGFADQSHFNKTFKSLSGINPNEYRNLKSSIIGHYFKVVR